MSVPLLVCLSACFQNFKSANGKAAKQTLQIDEEATVNSCSFATLVWFLKSCQSCLSAILMIFCMIKTFNILFIDCYCYAYVKLAIVIGRVRVQI